MSALIKATPEPYFLPYQAAWLKDTSRFKIAKKSRRVGLTYAQSYEDVRDAAKKGGMDVWFSSADESAAKEYIRYCGMWAKILNIGARDLGELVIDEKKGIKSLVIELESGKRIHGLTSNPKAFRSKGGKLILDEFAFHEDAEGMWKAARPIITWGYPVRIISTLNGTGNRYYRMMLEAERDNAEGKKSIWSLHTITINDAVEQGLADKIVGKPLSAQERKAWLDVEREGCGDEDAWRQEYLCEALDENSFWLSWDDITKAEIPEAGKPELYEGGNCYVGWDIARKRDLSVIWVVEQVGDVYITREVITMKRTSYGEQLSRLAEVMQRYRVIRATLDATGLGGPIVEQAQAKFGALRVEGLIFTSQSKQAMAVMIKQHFQDRRLRMPEDKAIRAAHRAIKQTKSAAGHARFDAERSEGGHADEFWAHALAIYASDGRLQPPAGGQVDADPGTYKSQRPGSEQRAPLFERHTGAATGLRARLRGWLAKTL